MFLSHSPATLSEEELLKGGPMKNVFAALVTSLAIVSLGVPTPSPALDSTVEMTAKPPKTVAAPRRMNAEVLAVNRGADALTVRSVANGKVTDVIFSVQESVASVLDTLEPGDRVLVTYVRVNDQLQAQRIVKAPEAAQSR
jgi:membrane-associated protease RseP (regulator of RpoE activity)